MLSRLQPPNARIILITLAILTAACGLYAFQKPFRQYPGIEYDNFPLPADWQDKTEFVFARLMYPQIRGGRGGRVFGAYGDGNWTQGFSMWTQDYPRADRHFLLALRRLSRVNARSVEQPVNLDDGDDVYNWPWLYAVQPGRWNLTDAQAAKLRDYILRGGFFMADDFWGDEGWQVFMASMQRVFPDREVVDLDNDNQIFHSVFDLSDRYQVPGARYRQTGVTEKCNGCPAAVARHFRRSRARDRRVDPQFRSRRFLGVGGRSHVSARNFPRWAFASE